MKNIFRFILLFAIVSLSCNSATDLFNNNGGTSGPILAVVTAASLDDQGELVDQSYSFLPIAPQMTVVIQVGELETSTPLSVTWYRVNDQGDEKLFEHTIQVDAFDRAYSIGLNRGLLAPGTYKAVASLGEQTQMITWIVLEEQAEPEADSTLQTRQGQAPVSGASGKVPASQRATGQPATTGPCTYYVTLWQSPPIVNFEAVALGDYIQCSLVDAGIEFDVAIGNAHTLLDGWGGQNPCDLENGSDLPGTVMTVSLRQTKSKQVLAKDTFVFKKDSAPPTVQLNAEPSQPLHDGKVQEGDKIVLTAIAEDSKQVPSWQSGISEVQIVKNPGDETLVFESNDAYKNKACNEKRLKRTTKEYTYVVPKGVKGDITFCAKAKDFAGQKANEKCHTFHTGKKVAGPMTQTMTGTGNGGTSVSQVDADLSLTLQMDGTLTGSGEFTYAFRGDWTTDCGPTSASIDPIKLTLPVTGTWTEDEIVFRITADAPSMTIETTTNCINTYTDQVDVSSIIMAGGRDWHAAWDGQAYTADDRVSSSSAGSTSELRWTIHLEPPAPAVGFSPRDWPVISTDQTSMLLAFP